MLFIVSLVLAILITCLVGCLVNLLMCILAALEVSHGYEPRWNGERLWNDEYDMDALEYLGMVDRWYPCPSGETLFCYDMTKS